MSGIVSSARVGGGRDRFADFSGPMVIRMIGDSNTVGYSGILENATGTRAWFLKYLESYRGGIRVVGSKGYGDTKFGSGTLGSFLFRLPWWENDGFSGEQIGYSLSNVSAQASSATLTTSTPHAMTAGALFRWTDAPAPFDENELYFVNTVPTTTTFTLKSTDAGSAINATETGSSFAGLRGLCALPHYLARNAPVRENMITIPSAGTNDILARTTAGDTPAAAATETHRRLRIFIEEVLRAWPDSDQMIVFGGLPPVCSGSASGASWADRQSAVVAYRALLESEVDARGSRFAYRNIWANASQADNLGDGVHWLAQGYRAAGLELGRLVRDVTRNASYGLAFPRTTLQLVRQPKLALTSTTGRVTGPSTTIGASTFAVAFSHKPDTGDLPADGTTRLLVWLGSSDYSTGFGIGTRNLTGVAGRAGLSVYLGGTLLQSAGLGPYYNYDSGNDGHKLFREGEWTDWLVLYNAESLRCVVWRNGELVNNTAISAAWNISANTWKIGHISAGLPAAEGHYQDFGIFTGSQLTVAACSEYAKARYHERANPLGAIDFRRLNEGTGTSAASTIYQQSAATLSGGATWVDADSSIAPWEV